MFSVAFFNALFLNKQAILLHSKFVLFQMLNFNMFYQQLKLSFWYTRKAIKTLLSD